MLKLNRTKFVEIVRELFEAGASNWTISDILIDMEYLETIPDMVYCFKTGSETRAERIQFRRSGKQEVLLQIKGSDLFEEEQKEEV